MIDKTKDEFLQHFKKRMDENIDIFRKCHDTDMPIKEKLLLCDEAIISAIAYAGELENLIRDPEKNN